MGHLHTIEDGRDPAGPYRLITTLLDHREAPAAELAGAYAQRWEIEASFDELKTHQRGARAVLRSSSRTDRPTPPLNPAGHRPVGKPASAPHDTGGPAPEPSTIGRRTWPPHPVAANARLRQVTAPLPTPRVGELAVPSYALFSGTEVLGKMAMKRMLAGRSTRRYGVGLEPVGEQVAAARARPASRRSRESS